MCRSAVLLLTLAFAFLPCGVGQSTAKAKLSFKLVSVHVKGLSRLTEEQIVQASGLQLGHTVGEPDFLRAVEKLGDTGLFTNVEYGYHYTAAGCDLELRVAENGKLVPLFFDNFVWFSDDELISLLRARVPLFAGQLPFRGTLSEQVADALNAILSEHKILGRVEYIPTAAMNGPIDSYTYKVTLHPIVIRNMDFPAAAPHELSVLQTAAKALSGQEYLRSAMRAHAKSAFLPLYLARGYLKAQFSDPQAKIVEDGPRTLVDVSFPVSAGIQYRVIRLGWMGVSAFPATQLEALVHLKTGEPPNAVQLQHDLEAVRKLYGTIGYLSVDVRENPTFDDTKGTVAYTIAVAEGDVFHMGDLQVDGIDAVTADKLAAQWQLKRGDIYDDSYLRRFFQVTYHDVSLSRSYSVVPKQTINREGKTVNVALHFVPKR
jgi:outer membrane protein assembly factor BamA